MHSSNLKKYRDILEKKKEELLAEPARTPAPNPAQRAATGLINPARKMTSLLCLKQTDSKLLRAIEEASCMIRDYGIAMDCENENCGTARGCAWTRVCINCKEKQQS